MHDFQIPPDDPRLTAYALGELEGDERATVEAALRADPELREKINDIRSTVARIESALAAEAAEPIAGGMAPLSLRKTRMMALWRRVTEGARGREAAVERANGYAHASQESAPRGGSRRPRRRSAGGVLVRFPQLYYVIGGAAAAGLAVLVALRRDEYDARQRAAEENARAILAENGAAVAAPVISIAPSGTLAPVASTAPVVSAASAETGATAVVRLVAETETTTSAPAHEAVAVAMSPASVETRAASAANTTSVASGTSGTSAIAGDTSAVAVESPRAGAGGLRSELSLLEQVKREAAGEERALALELSRRADAAEAERASTEAPAVQLAAAQPDATAPAREPADRIALENGPELVPAQEKLFVAPAIGVAPAEYSRTPTQGSEVVTLSPVRVTADRDRSYGSLTGSRRRVASADFEAERSHLPRPPPGAKFGRRPEDYVSVRDNPFVSVAAEPRSTFAADADTASYPNVRRMIARGELPPRDAVRIEEMLNYFPYRYAAPGPRALSFWERLLGADSTPPLAATLEVAEAPWAANHRLVRIGLKGREAPAAPRPRANLVFLLDVSTSMNEPNKLPLVKESLRLLIGKLQPDDRVAVVTYGGIAGLALPPTAAVQEREIVSAIEALTPGGGRGGGGGIRQAYDLARANFVAGGINRVILCTDGDFELGPSSERELVRLVQEQSGTGVFLTVLGFGMGDGNYRDALLEQLASSGNGSYGYIASRREAQKLLVEQVNSTLVTVAEDVRIQVEFNPAKVGSYRLIGYENRLLRKEDFNVDAATAGDIGAGHALTALYEIVPAAGAGAGGELLTVRVRYKKPHGFFGRSLEFPLADSASTFAGASADFRFAAAVAEMGMILRTSAHKGTGTVGDVIAWATAAASPADDPGGYRAEFVEFARSVQALLRAE